MDDESLERDLLLNHIPWHDMGFTVSGSAINGLDALGQVQLSAPDIVITDIHMPVMNGIEFAEKMRSMNIKSKIIFITAFSDFEYARAAIGNEVSAYLLKPIDVEELKAILTHLSNKIALEKNDIRSLSALANDYLSDILQYEASDNSVSLQDICLKLNSALECPSSNVSFYIYIVTIDEFKYLFSIHKDGINILGSIKREINDLHNIYPVILSLLNSSLYLLISRDNIIDQLSEWRLHNQYTKTWLSICYWPHIISMFALQQQYSKYIAIRNEYIYFNGVGQLIDFDSCSINSNISIHNNTDYIKPLLYAIEKKDRHNIHFWVGKYISTSASSTIFKDRSSMAINLLDTIFNTLFNQNKCMEQYKMENSTYYSMLLNIETISIQANLLADIFYKYSHILGDSCDNHFFNLSKQIKRLIDDGFSSELSVQAIAQSFYMSSNHLNTQFKEAFGQSIGKYIISVRMNHAMDLLRNTNMSIREIAFKCGYESFSHFVATFRKLHSITPRHYRIMNRGNNDEYRSPFSN